MLKVQNPGLIPKQGCSANVRIGARVRALPFLFFLSPNGFALSSYSTSPAAPPALMQWARGWSAGQNHGSD